MLRIFAYLWAAPNTIFGLLFVAFASGRGDRVVRRGGVIGCYGPTLKSYLSLAPIGRTGAAAMTLGHVIIAANHRDFERSLQHELVHVRQYERWGVFFLPAYALSSLIAHCRGLHHYRDNHFEREAFAAEPPQHRLING